MHWQWQPISPEGFQYLSVLVQILLAMILTKDYTSNPYVFAVDDGIATQSMGSVLTGLDKYQIFAVCCLINSATAANSVVLV